MGSLVESEMVPESDGVPRSHARVLNSGDQLDRRRQLSVDKSTSREDFKETDKKDSSEKALTASDFVMFALNNDYNVVVEEESGVPQDPEEVFKEIIPQPSNDAYKIARMNTALKRRRKQRNLLIGMIFCFTLVIVVIVIGVIFGG